MPIRWRLITLRILVDMEKWLDKAYEQADKSSKEYIHAEEVLESFMDNHSTDLLDQWSQVEDKEYVDALFFALQGTEKGILAIRSLCAQFFINGYLIGKREK